MPTPRQQPFLASAWLTSLVVGAKSCEWSTWFKAHYLRTDAEKVSSTTDWTPFRLAHTALLNKARTESEQQGYTVSTEQQNTFFLKGPVATLLGVPDLIAVKGTDGVIIDAKSNKAQPGHPAQVQLYMWAVPQGLVRYKGMAFSGLLYYPGAKTFIPNTAVDKAFVANLRSLITRVASPQYARRVPSSMECRFCDITHADCSKRAFSDEPNKGLTDEF